MNVLGLLWRYLVLNIAVWFLAGLVLGHDLPRPLPAKWVAASVGVSFALAWLWERWSRMRKNRAQT
jgi:hypothetical protein